MATTKSKPKTKFEERRFVVIETSYENTLYSFKDAEKLINERADDPADEYYIAEIIYKAVIPKSKIVLEAV